jgi:hypothetical protein
MSITPQSSSSQIIIYQTEDGNTHLEVRLEQETIWLTQKMIAELFQVSIPTINELVRNVYKEADLAPEAIIRKFRIVEKEGQPTIGCNILDYDGKMLHQIAHELTEVEYDKFHLQLLQIETWKANEDDFQQLAEKLEKIHEGS